MNTKEIKKVLRATRKKLEQYIKHRKLWFNPEDLGGACGLSSAMVFRVLKDLGYRPVFHMNDYHCFVTVNGYWADLTLKQFNDVCPEVYLSRQPYRKDHGYGNVHKRSQSAKTERKMRRLFQEWPSEQNPFRQKLPSLTITTKRV